MGKNIVVQESCESGKDFQTQNQVPGAEDIEHCRDAIGVDDLLTKRALHICKDIVRYDMLVSILEATLAE